MASKQLYEVQPISSDQPDKKQLECRFLPSASNLCPSETWRWEATLACERQFQQTEDVTDVDVEGRYHCVVGIQLGVQLLGRQLGSASSASPSPPTSWPSTAAAWSPLAPLISFTPSKPGLTETALVKPPWTVKKKKKNTVTLEWLNVPPPLTPHNFFKIYCTSLTFVWIVCFRYSMQPAEFSWDSLKKKKKKPNQIEPALSSATTLIQHEEQKPHHRGGRRYSASWLWLHPLLFHSERLRFLYCDRTGRSVHTLSSIHRNLQTAPGKKKV